MVLDAFGVLAGDLRGDAEIDKEPFNDLMTQPALLGKRPALVRKEDPAIRPARNQPLVDQPFEHTSDRWLCNAEPAGDIDLSRLTSITQEIVDQLDIVFEQFDLSCLARMAKSFRLHIGIDKRFWFRSC